MGLQLHTVLIAFVHLPHTFGLYFQSHRFKAILLFETHIRLMVDVLLTMNEAFRIAGVEFPVHSPQTKRTGD